MKNMAAVERKKKSYGSKTYSLVIKYGMADAKTCLQGYVRDNPLLTNSPMTKSVVVDLFLKKLSFIPRRSGEPLAEWLFNQALDGGYLVEVPPIWHGDNKEYIVSRQILDKKPGPKKKVK
jgi:hypothetical protein